MKKDVMGTFRQKLSLINYEKQDLKIDIECVPDTGATYSWIPAELLEKIQVLPKFKRKFKITDGSIIERDMAVVHVELAGQTLPTIVAFGDRGSEPLLGAFTLEGFGLTVDPVNKTLVPVPALLLGFFKSTC
jgi:clan AA aspartic protease